MHRRAESGSRGLLLYVEDDPAQQHIMKALLELEGYGVIAAGDGDEALRALRVDPQRPDVILVDYHLPGELNGTEVAEEISRAVGCPLPTIILTGDLANAEAPWMPGVPVLPITKPVDPDVLLKAIELFVSFHRFQRAHAALPPQERALG